MMSAGAGMISIESADPIWIRTAGAVDLATSKEIAATAEDTAAHGPSCRFEVRCSPDFNIRRDIPQDECGPVLAPGGSTGTSPPSAPLARWYAVRGRRAPPMDYRNDHRRQRPNQTALACPYNQHEDTFGMMARRPVPKIRRYRFRFVEPVVHLQIIFRDAAPFLRRREGMMIAMSHNGFLQNTCCKCSDAV